MKQFCCGDVVPGCTAIFRAQSENELLSQIAAHARDDHGLSELPAALIQQVHSYIYDVSGA